MKISFPKYGPSELLINKRGVPYITSFIVICFFVGLCASYLLKNHFWLLMIVVLSIVGILLCLGAAVGIFFNWRKVAGAPSAIEAPSASINENGPRISSQWDYRPRKASRVSAVLDGPRAETSDVLSPEPFMTNNNVSFSEDSLGGAPAEELITTVLSELTDTACTAPIADDAAVRGTTKVL
jgi:hypothetical protein